MSRETDIVVAAILERVEPQLDRLIGAVNTCHQNVLILQDRIEVLEQDKADLAAMINDYQSLQAQVKTLQFEVARLENLLEGKAEPSPWK